MNDTNTGDQNTGDRNTGDWNTGSWNTGFFCTTTPDTVRVFDSAEVNRQEFLAACPGWFLAVNPAPLVAGTPQARSMHEAWATAWDDVEDKPAAAAEVRDLPGFDYDVWLEITGIKLDGEHFPSDPPQTVIVDGRTYRLES